MTAVILAGGDGLRMRPLTCSVPKAMLRVCNVPLIEYNNASLRRHGISDVIIAADRFSKEIADYFDSDREDIPKLSLSHVPEGTSAALQKAVSEWDVPKDEHVLVINGASLSDFNYKEIMRAHKYGGNTLTVVLKKTAHPHERITAVAENGILKDMVLCQSRESCVSDMALTGMFVINASLALRISEYGGDFYTEALPALIKSGIKINVYEESGYFALIRTPEDLLKVNADVLNGAYPFFPVKSSVGFSAGEGTEIKEPVCIGENTDISSDVTIGEKAVIGRNVTIGKGAKILGGVIGDGVYIGEKCTVNHAVIGNSVIISAGASVFEGAVIGENALIAESAIVNQNVKIWNGRHVEPFACAAADLKYGFARPVVINDEGITGETNGSITPQTASVIGSSAASIGRKIAVGCRGTSAAHALAMALSSGIMASGGEAWFLGEASEPELAECVRICGASAGCYIDAGITAKIKFFSSDGLSLSRSEEKLIEGGINRGEYRRSGYSHFGPYKNCPDIKELYRGRLMRLRPDKLTGIRAVVNAPEKHISELCDMLLKGINDKDGVPVVFHISGDGTKLSAYTEETGYVFHDRLTLLCCRKLFEEGKDAALPYDFPAAADTLAEKYGRTVLRYSGCPSDRSDKGARKLAAETSFAVDGAELMIRTLSVLSERGESLKDACGSLPEFAEINRFVALDSHKWHHMNILRELCSEKQYSSDGIVINDKRGRVRIRPVKTGKGVMMHVESTRLEIAEELCDFYQDTLNALAKKGLLK